MGEKKGKRIKLRKVGGGYTYGHKPYPDKPGPLARLKKRLAPAAKRGRKAVKKKVKKVAKRRKRKTTRKRTTKKKRRKRRKKK